MRVTVPLMLLPETLDNNWLLERLNFRRCEQRGVSLADKQGGTSGHFYNSPHTALLVLLSRQTCLGFLC